MKTTFLLTALCVVAGTAFASDADKVARVDGHPDLNGTWENGSGYDFIKPQKGPNGSICVSGCKAANGGPPPRRVRVEPDRPKYKPELMAKVEDLTKRQVETDPVLRCKAHRVGFHLAF